ncbi:putative SWI/SNF-related matrix-associated actin-dependent regulator of chromatin subfamily A member 3-like 1 [Andrographis paniculata]|uniref:putative SWI/SNF-related matrix-associated actin-dependent regulator of chromatin subfamily A member 3-like 1 n=1 Tax=Andrographis paniculata TaxID=175694 RepID=UPI0021E70EC2|nr:putative SWI/SNF-related matrix-associated actin-dependent regulator of chromatin subfamily A member 3-like 1 [Andrographis paniculata]
MEEIAAELNDRPDPVETYMRLDRWPSPPDDAGGGEIFLVGFVIVNVVGLRHYQGTISSHELVGLVREDTNPFDGNAIRVMNMRSVQVGHIERSAAAVLSPLIDAGLITVEGIVPKPPGKKYAFRIPCQVHIFSRMEDIDRVKSAINVSMLHLISEANPSFTLSEAVAVKEKKGVPAEKSVDEIFKLLEAKVSMEGVSEELDPPQDIIKSKLFPYQKEGLGWLVSRENSTELPPFWVEKNGFYVNELTNYQTGVRPEPLRGGIFADDMGLGKTLTLLSLIAFDKWIHTGHQSCNGDVKNNDEEEESIALFGRKRKRKRGSQKTKSEDLNNTQDAGKRPALDELSSSEPKTTLIVCPPSVLSTWITQLEQHTRKGSLKAYMYYGERTKDANELQRYDIVLTTYSTLGSDETIFRSPINKIEWRRVILDEAHVIKNVEAKQSQAVLALNAKRRWAVTGTPVQNSSCDLYSLVAFLKFEPLSLKKFWDSLIERPLVRGDEKGISRLQVLIAAISLRRMKDKGLIGLPSKTIETLFVDLNEEERRVYDQMEVQARDIVESYVSNEGVVRNYYTVLSVLVRLRQICNDLSLCPAEIRDLLPPSQIEDVKNNPSLLKKLLAMLQDDEGFDCPICISPPTDIVITCCAHIFCRSCILKTLKRSKPCCPMCRHQLSESDLFQAPPDSSQTAPVEASSLKSSSKVATLLKLLSAAKAKNPSSKSVIFSQFRKMLILLEEPLKQAGFKVIRLDGTMNAKRRANVIKEFCVPAPDGPTILLASLKASNAGVNLTAASTVYLMEPWWNPAVEEQAMDRVHRIGQKEDVKVVRLIARNTIEERIMQLQEKKKLLARKAFSRYGQKDKREISRDDLSMLMNL